MKSASKNSRFLTTQREKAAVRCWVLAGVLALVTGCGTTETVRHAFMGSGRYPARAPHAECPVVSGTPVRPFVEVAEIHGDSEQQLFGRLSPPKEAELMELLRKRAREIGGDAIIHYTSYELPGLYRAQGTVIRWSD